MSTAIVTVTRKVSMTLVGVDGNAFAIMGAWSKQARREGWDEGDIADVLHRATQGDYNNLLRVISNHCSM